MESDIPLPSPPRNTARDTRAAAGKARATAFSSRTSQQLNTEKFGAPPPSSDPPLFSSDDFQSSTLENYSTSHTQDRGPLRKRRYRGTWWGEQLNAKKQKKRSEFKDKRYVDSGVWLGSEDSRTDLLASSDDTSFTQAGEEEVGDNGPADGEQEADSVKEELPGALIPQSSCAHEETYSRLARVDIPVESESHRRARSAIIRCLEDGNDNVDLSYFNMATIPPGLFRPLVQLTKEPAVREPPLAEDVYTPLEPFLRLFLTRNLLTCLPGEVLELEGLRVLSLRHNKLTEIPCAIRNLSMLQDLNVAGNRLKHLPWEILRLMQAGDLRQLTVHPNPFLELEEDDIAQWHCHGESETDDDNEGKPTKLVDRLKAIYYHDKAPPEAWAPVHVATSKTEYLDPDGRPLPNPDASTNTQQGQKRPLSTSCKSSSTATPSLLELSLRACTRSNQLARFFDPNDPDDLSFYPDPVFRLLSTAKHVKDAGGRVCSVCSRPYVVPRTQWVEWWDCITFENGSKNPRKSGQELYPLPFLRRGCSLACGPDC